MICDFIRIAAIDMPWEWLPAVSKKQYIAKNLYTDVIDIVCKEKIYPRRSNRFLAFPNRGERA